jgi:atypical dual specificity phosphatase
VYDRDSGAFFDRETIYKLIENLSFFTVPLIFQGTTTLEKLKELVHTQSQFYDGPIEGVYVRAYENNILKYRGKIVRSNFICGDGHWTKGKYITNKLHTKY